MCSLRFHVDFRSEYRARLMHIRSVHNHENNLILGELSRAHSGPRECDQEIIRTPTVTPTRVIAFQLARAASNPANVSINAVADLL